MPLDLPPARVKMRALAAADRIAHWRLDESSGTVVADDAGASHLTSTSSANIVEAPFPGAGTTYGRAFSSTSSASGASTAGQRTALAADALTFEAWIDGSHGTIVQHGASGETQATNVLLDVRLDNTLPGIRVFWERSAGTNVFVNVPLSAALSGLHHIAVRCDPSPDGSSYRRVTVFVDGAWVLSQSAVNKPDGGGSGAWYMGDDAIASNPFDGTIYEVRISACALDDAAILESYARGVRTYGIERAIASGHPAVFAQVLVLDDNDLTWWDLTWQASHDFVDDIEWGEDQDDQGQTARLTFAREVFAHSLAPFMASSSLNTKTTAGQMLTLGRRLRINVAVAPHGASWSAVWWQGLWHLAFDGVVTGIDWGGDGVVVDAHDRFAALQDTWIELDTSGATPTEREYGSDLGEPLEDVLQEIIDDNEPATVGYLGGLPTIYVPTSPAWNRYAFSTPSDASVGQRLEEEASLIGWLCRFRFDDARQEYRLTLYEPDRAATWTSGDPVFAPEEQLAVQRVRLERGDLRNVVDVEWVEMTDATTPTDEDSVGRGRRQVTRYEDAASITQYGRRYCRVGDAMTAALTTQTEVDRLGNAMLDDLSEPKADVEVMTHLRYDLLLHDLVKLEADGRHWDTDQVFAVVGLRHRVSATEARTTMSLRSARPSGKRRRWWDIIVSGGLVRGNNWRPVRIPGVSPVSVRLPRGIEWQWPLPSNIGNRQYAETEVHISTSSGFTPSSSTLAGIIRGNRWPVHNLTPGETQYAKVVHRDRAGNVAAASPEASSTARHSGNSLKARASGSASKSLGTSKSSETRMRFATTDYDPFSCVTTDANVTYFTAPVTGKYRLTTQVACTVDTGLSESWTLRAYKNGESADGSGTGTVVAKSATPAEDEDVVVSLVSDVALAAGDTLCCKLSPKHGSARASVTSTVADGNRSFFAVVAIDED